MLDNKDLWMDGSEVVIRLNKRNEAIAKINKSLHESEQNDTPVVKKPQAKKTNKKI
jgi:hypothetical protein